MDSFNIKIVNEHYNFFILNHNSTTFKMFKVFLATALLLSSTVGEIIYNEASYNHETLKWSKIF